MVRSHKTSARGERVVRKSVELVCERAPMGTLITHGLSGCTSSAIAALRKSELPSSIRGINAEV